VKFNSVLLLVAIISTMFVSGCGSSSTPINVSVTPSVTAIGTGQTSQFVAAVSDGFDAHGWAVATTWLTAAYILSRGIAKASRVLEQ